MISSTEDISEEISESPVQGISIPSDEQILWLPELSDLERLNVMNAPLEDKARILSSQTSSSVDETLSEISKKQTLHILKVSNFPKTPLKFYRSGSYILFAVCPFKRNQKVRFI